MQLPSQAGSERQGATPKSSSTPALAMPTEARQHKLKVLVADDDRVSRMWLSHLLGEWGYDVVCASTGGQALRILESDDSPSLALLDWIMPEMDGTEVCSRVRQLNKLHYTYIVLLTSKNQQSELVEGLASGADEYLKKPFDPPELRARLDIGSRIAYQKALQRSEERFQAAFESAGVGMALAGPDGHWFSVNRAMAEMLGYNQAELLQKTFADVTHPDDLAASKELFNGFLKGDLPIQQIEKRYIRKDKAVVWGLLTVSLVRNPDGTPAYAVAQVQNITQRKIAQQAVQESEKLFRAITENAHDLITVADPSGSVLYASPAHQELLGYSSTELHGRSAYGWIHPDDHELLRQRILQLAELGELKDIVQVRLRHRNGHWVTAEAHLGAIRNQQGAIDRLVIISRIMDDWIATQRVLQEREEQLAQLLDSTAEAIYGMDLRGRCTFCNKAFLRMMQYQTMDELLGENMHRLIHHHKQDGSHYAVEDCKIYQAIERNQASHVDDEVLWRADGSYFPAEYWSYPIQSKGQIIGCVVTFIDISERKKAQDALRNAHMESELFINSVPSILIGLDANRRITRWNLAAEQTFELRSEEVQGKPLLDCGIHWTEPDMAERIEAWQHIEGSERFDHIRFEKHGHARSLGITVSSVRFPNDQATGVLVTGADTTERKALESQLRQAQKLEAIGQLAAGIAHEINTPIQYVGDNVCFVKDSWESASQVLSASRTLRDEAQRGNVSESALNEFDRLWNEADLEYLYHEVPRAIDQSQDGIGRVARIVRAMKEFSHPGSEQRKALDINRAIETTITVARNEWKYVAELRTSFDDKLPMVPCHAGEFNQVILNIIVNAAHAIAEVVGDGGQTKGTITISTRREGEWAEIRIEDTGCGIPEHLRVRVFEPFFTTKEVGKGTGQGLMMAHAVIVKKHGGRIWFESETGKGTTFFIRLPLAVSEGGERHETHPLRG